MFCTFFFASKCYELHQVMWQDETFIFLKYIFKILYQNFENINIINRLMDSDQWVTTHDVIWNVMYALAWDSGRVV